MRITYRSIGNKDYWSKRWKDVSVDSPMENANAYPLKYAEMTIQDKSGKILEAGCGAGRVLRYYHERGYMIKGMDFIDIAISKLKASDPTLDVHVGDITDLVYPDQSFRYVLAFGLYHNLETGLDEAINETYRVLENGGFLCASFRADNIQTRLTDWLAALKFKNNLNSSKVFHKMNLTRYEIEDLFKRAGFMIDVVKPVENMPILYKFSIFRSSEHKKFDEHKARSEGFRLSYLGNILQKLLMCFFPDQFCNIYVVIAKKGK